MDRLKLTSLQFALFYRDIISRPDLEFSELNSSMMNIFNGIPTSMNLPPEIPADIPLITYRSENGDYSCAMARSRLDLHFIKTDEISNEEILVDFNAKVTNLVSYILSKRDIVRFGFICRYFKHSDTPIRDIQLKYCASNMPKVEDIGFRFNQASSFNGWEINDMVEIAAYKLPINGKTEDGIFIQRDINNTPIPDQTITEGDLKKISAKYSSLLNQKNIEGLIE